MKLVIDIPDEYVEQIKNNTEGSTAESEAVTAIRTGVPYKEIPQGEWIVTAEDNHGVHRICCPFCSYEKGSNNTDTIIVTFSNFPKFCENCGAKMQKGSAE